MISNKKINQRDFFGTSVGKFVSSLCCTPEMMVHSGVVSVTTGFESSLAVHFFFVISRILHITKLRLRAEDITPLVEKHKQTIIQATGRSSIGWVLGAIKVGAHLISH